MKKTLDTGVTLVTKRTPEELVKIMKEHINFMLYPEFELLNSPMGILLVDTKHPDFKGIVENCITYVKMFGDKESAEKYNKLIE